MDDDFEKELKEGFLEEAQQLVDETEQCFLNLESSPNDAQIINEIFRLAHSLKGSSKAVGFEALGQFTHELETFLLKIKEGQVQVTSDVVSLLLRCNDHLSHSIQLLKTDFDAGLDNAGIIQELLAAQEQTTAPEATPPQQETLEDLSPASAAENPAQSEATSQTPQSETAAEVPVNANQLHVVEGQESAPVEDLNPLKIPTSGSANEAKAKATKPAQKQDESIRVSLDRVESLLNYVGELVILKSVLVEQVQASDSTLLRKSVRQLDKVTKEVQDLSMSLRMVPLRQTFMKMQRVVRDTSASLDKKISLSMEGEDTEIDKTILERLTDPLVHILRNAADHGIESTEDREASGKPKEGNVHLRAFHQSGMLIIEVSDDGGGIDPERLRQKAIEKGILSPEASISDQEAIELIFHPGFSTKSAVTDISGRGVGMDVVKSNIEGIQGQISVESTLGEGSRFQLRLPLTLAIIEGIVVMAGTERYVIPLSHVREFYRPTENDIHNSSTAGNFLRLRGENIPLYDLAQLVRRKSAASSPLQQTSIVISTLADPFAVLVDDVIGQYQIVVKNLGQEHANAKGFSGSSVLGDGRPALILELSELIQKNNPTSHKGLSERRVGT